MPEAVEVDVCSTRGAAAASSFTPSNPCLRHNLMQSETFDWLTYCSSSTGKQELTKSSLVRVRLPSAPQRVVYPPRCEQLDKSTRARYELHNGAR